MNNAAPRSVQQFPTFVAAPHARVRLLCFPFAGGGSLIYRAWQRTLGPDFEILAYEPPARASRFSEKPIHVMDELLADVRRGLDEIERRTASKPGHGGEGARADDKKRLAVFGHSMGGRIAYAFTSAKIRPVEHLFLSATRPPFFESRMRSNAADDDLKKELARLGGTPKEILEDEEMLKLFMPTMRGDFAIVETELEKKVLDVPVTAISGTHDQEATPEMVKRWRELAKGAFEYAELDAPHFYLEKERESVLLRIRRAFE